MSELVGREGGERTTESHFEVYKDKSNEYRWRLKAPNAKIIADSGEGYRDKQDCSSGIELVKKYAPTAPIEDLT